MSKEVNLVERWHTKQQKQVKSSRGYRRELERTHGKDAIAQKTDEMTQEEFEKLSLIEFLTLLSSDIEIQASLDPQERIKRGESKCLS